MFRKLLTAAAFSLVSASAAQADALNLTLSGGNPGGLWSLLGAGIDRAMKRVDENSVITYQATGGGFANIGLLARGRTDLGMVHNAEVKIALAGEEPFRSPITNMRAIGYVYNWAPMHFFISGDIARKHNIKSIADLAKSPVALRVGINRPGNITNKVAVFMLAEAGVTEDVLKSKGGSFIQAGANGQADLMKDGRLDVVTNGIFILHRSFRKIDTESDVVLLTVPDSVIEATNKKFGTQTFVIPKGSYSKQGADIKSAALGAMLVTHDKLSDKIAYDFAKALVANIDDVRKVHKSMGALNAKLLVNQDVLPFHPGAEKAYREAGLIK